MPIAELNKLGFRSSFVPVSEKRLLIGEGEKFFNDIFSQKGIREFLSLTDNPKPDFVQRTTDRLKGR